jgi:hypothetical protein
MLNEFKNMNNNIPEDYFSDFKSQLVEKVEDMDMINLIDEAPVLSSIKKETGFNIPENYFENLSISTSVADHQTKLIKIYRISRIAASVVLFMIVGVFALNYNQTKPSSENQLLAEYEFISNELGNENNIFEYIMAEEENYFEYELEDTEIESLIESNIDLFELTELEELL